ncbi:MAG: HEAT repeat domain-containing protein [Candidatus Firestonebacteria bacterium]
MKKYYFQALLLLLTIALFSSCATLGKRSVSRDQVVRQAALLELEKENESTKSEIAAELLVNLETAEFSDKEYAVEALVKAAKNSPEVMKQICNSFSGKEPSARGYLEEVVIKSGYDAVPALLESFKNQNKNIRLHSAYAIGRIKPPVKEAIPGLIDLLKDEDSGVSSAARDALIANGEVDTAVLLKRLADENPSVRRNIAFILGRCFVAVSGEEAIGPLLTLLSDENLLVRSAANDTLVKIAASGRGATPILLKHLKESGSHFLQVALVNILGSAGQSSMEAVPLMQEYLTGADSELKAASAEALSRLSSEDPSVAAALLKALSDIDGEVRSKAAASLGRMKVSLPEILSALVKMFEDEYVYARVSAQDSVVKIAPYTQAQASALLLSCLTNSMARVRSHAALALGNLNNIAKDSVPALLPLLADKDKDVRRAVIEAFGVMGLFAKEAAPAVINGLKDSEKTVRIEAEKTIERLGFLSKETVASLADALKDRDTEFTGTIKKILFRIGPVAISALVKKLNDEDAAVRQGVASVLGRIGRTVPNIREALEGLTALLNDKNAAVRVSAAVSLGEIGMNNKEIITGLIDALRDSEAEVRFSAAAALGKIGAFAKDAAPYLVGLLKDESNKVRNAARDSLASIGSDAVDPLLEALKNQDEKVRLAAVQALEKIGSQKAREAVKSYRSR